MINIEGIQFFHEGKYNSIKDDIIDSYGNNLKYMSSLITISYLNEKRGTLKTQFEKNTLDYFYDVIIESADELKKNWLSWSFKSHELLFYKNLSKLVLIYGSFEKAYKRINKDFKIKKTGIVNPCLSIFFDNNKKIIVIKLDDNFIFSKYNLYSIHKEVRKTKRNVFFRYCFFEDEDKNVVQDFYSLTRKNKTLLIENIVEKKFQVECKNLKERT